MVSLNLGMAMNKMAIESFNVMDAFVGLMLHGKYIHVSVLSTVLMNFPIQPARFVAGIGASFETNLSMQYCGKEQKD